MSNGKFEIFLGSNTQYYFRLKAPNGEIIGHSEGYTTKQSAENGIVSVRINSQDDGRYSVWQSTQNSQWYFNLKAGNGEIILASQGYASKQGALTGAGAVKKYAPDAPVFDLT